jgi:hypothetical protein
MRSLEVKILPGLMELTLRALPHNAPLWPKSSNLKCGQQIFGRRHDIAIGTYNHYLGGIATVKVKVCSRQNRKHHRYEATSFLPARDGIFHS